MGLIDLLGPSHLDDRKAISRRVVKIPIENTAFTTAKDGIDEASTAFQKVDDVNKLYFTKYNDNIVGKYFNEKTAIDGIILGSVIEQNLIDSASQTDYNIFFEKGLNFNPFMIPLINYQVDSVNTTMANPFKSDGTVGGTFQVWEINRLALNQIVTIQDDDTGPVSGYIQNISGATAPFTLTIYDTSTSAALDLQNYTVDKNAKITNVSNPYFETNITPYIKEIYDVLITGIAGGIASIGTFTYATKTIAVTTNTWTIGQLIIGDNGIADGAVLEITSLPAGAMAPYTYSVREVASTGNNVTANWTGTFGGFTNTQRENLSGSSYDNALNALASFMKDWIYNTTDDWELYLTSQKTALTNNEEIRTAKQAENTAALADVNNALLVISTWKAKPDTGATGKFSDGEINTIDSEITARNVFIASRLTQIETSLGGIVDYNDGTYDPSGTNQDALYVNYDLMNKRINRIFGSLSKYIRNSSSSNNLQQLTDVNTDFSDTSGGIPGTGLYDNDIIVTKFVQDSNGTNIIEVESASGLSVGDSVFIVSETQVELPLLSIPGSIIAISPKITVSGGTSITTYLVTLSFQVPDTYIKLDLARLYKIL